MAVKHTWERHAIAFPTKVLAAEGGEHILNCVADKDRDNGEIVEIKKCESFDNYSIQDTTEFEGTVIALADNGTAIIEVTSEKEVVFVYNVPNNPYARTKAEKDEHLFYNAKGDMLRGYILHKRDMIAESAENFDTKTLPAVGDVVVSAAGKLKKKA